MINTSTINDLSNKIRELIDQSPVSDLNKNINALIKGTLTKMELVTREEYDVQTAALAKTREKLELLEEKLTRLENIIKQSQ
jgi:ubiquinone biosynthesis accessory factor UbiK